MLCGRSAVEAVGTSKTFAVLASAVTLLATSCGRRIRSALPEVVPVLQVLDEPRMRRLPPEHLPRHLTGGRVVHPPDRAEEGEALTSVRCGDAGHRHASPAPDGGRDVTERDALVRDRV